MTPDDVVQATATTVGKLGAAFYFHPATVEHGKKNLNLDGFRFYILGRGGVLGNTSASAVASAFGYFEPSMITRIWDSAAERCDPVKAATEYLDCNASLGRATLTAETADFAALEAFCDAAEAVCSSVDPAGLALYAGTVDQALPADLPGRVMQLIVNHRELRGSQHLAVIAAAGMSPFAAHAARRPNDVALFGWPEDATAPPGTTEALQAIDARTQELNVAAYASLTDDQRTAFAAGVAEVDRAFAD